MRMSLPCLALALAGCATTPDATKPPPPVPLTLDLADPVVEAEIAGVPLRLRVDFQQKDVIELNPAAAARLAVKWEDGFDVAVGRVVLQGRQARAPVLIGGVAIESVVAEHGRDCCAGVDGAISPASLPYDPVRLVRQSEPEGRSASYPATISAETGLTLAQPLGRETLRVRLALDGETPIATASAGAVLAKAQGGRFVGPVFRVTPAFGVSRQARTMVFARPPLVAGFPLERVAVRFADFSGGRTLPLPGEGDGEGIEVRGRAPPPQRDWPSVSLGRQQLDRCREIAFHRAQSVITLDCRFGS
ncbi:hypothetical protein SAMN05192580_0964 [Sphingomonas jatrophae]|uniref:Lipoprotein n=2 Tax=Sphingomonas jatrophae TaxID=1166337 RepID=A0A1I6JVX9_9SPHN|nr:hypothetical protein SAMN05192580_0964 [Sphingomonas jatrophae]